MAKDISFENEALIEGKLKFKHLLGRKFEHGGKDCYGLLRDLYKDNLGIEMTNYARHDDWWIDGSTDFYMDKFPKEGFVAIDEPLLSEIRPFDVFLITIPDPRSPENTKTNHCAIYLNDGYIIHHRMGKLSELKLYKGFLKNFTTCIIRHKDVPDMRESEVNKLDLMDFILPHKRQLLMEAIDDNKKD